MESTKLPRNPHGDGIIVCPHRLSRRVHPFPYAPSEKLLLSVITQPIPLWKEPCPVMAEERRPAAVEGGEEYEDLLPAMAERLEAEEFVKELCGGFSLLADPRRGLITAESLRRNAGLLGMEGMTAEDAAAMVREGDMDGDGALGETEFCILMVRLSPGMMEDAEEWLERAIEREIARPSGGAA